MNKLTEKILKPCQEEKCNCNNKDIIFVETVETTTEMEETEETTTEDVDKITTCENKREEYGKAFSCKNSLNRRREVHSGVQPFACSQCQKHFPLASSLKKHVVAAHPEEMEPPVVYICGYCEKDFHSKSRLRTHLKRHFNIKSGGLDNLLNSSQECGNDFSKENVIAIPPPKKKDHILSICGYCGAEFRRKYRLRVHMKIHFRPKPEGCSSITVQYKCQVCEMEFISKAQVNQHRIIHPDIKPFFCSPCQRHFQLLSSFKKHVACFHPEDIENPQIYTCGYCAKEFYLKTLLRHHLKYYSKSTPDGCSNRVVPSREERIKKMEEKKLNAPRYLCEECGSDYSSKQTLNLHISKKHAPVDTGTEVVCSHCQEQFINSDHLMTHMASVHPEEIQVPNFSLFICGYCEKEFPTKIGLRTHIKLHSEVKPSPKFVCETCGKEFLALSKLKKHSLTHSGIKPFICSLCAKAFSQVCNLKKHTTAIHPENIVDPDVFVCGFCQKEFHVKERLKMHMRTHSGVRPYKCSSCPMTFCRPSQLTFHQVSHSKDKRFSCPHCPVKYISQYKLRDHIKKHETLKLSCPCGKNFVNARMHKSHMTKYHTETYGDVTCPICNKTLKGHLKDHLLIHSGERKHKCQVCGAAFLMPTALRVHLRTHKGVS